MKYTIGVSVPSLHRESTNLYSVCAKTCIKWSIICCVAALERLK